jgi:hypothetical protein
MVTALLFAIFLFSSPVVGQVTNDGSCTTAMAQLVSSMPAPQPKAVCSNGKWTVTGDFTSSSAWWCYEPITITGKFTDNAQSLIQFVFDIDNPPGSSLTIQGGPNTFQGFVSFWVLTPRSGNYPTGVHPFIFLTTNPANTLVANQVWSGGSVSWKDYNSVDPCYRATLNTGGVFISPDRTQQDAILSWPKGDCNTPAIITGLQVPNPPTPPPAPVKPTPVAKPTVAKTPTAPPPPGSSKPMPTGALVGIIILAFLIVIVLVATIVFVCVKSTKSGVENF